ncbi:tRNA pseudouridine(38-40) synthase TruA [Halopseudomonas salegens]|uniref:tRNA pseudouridine synthase A n=1 Tax=Halopseudomonas salegens TaxID=1434072 RepID=A0A1H2F277_9GAMM|nr:tRNA pseudouridine(38-40) synthase TruA [Halopseudomonas salegens]SDU01437.1 tRNA pseudouridine38-40 synthase [Halopseudomonas salegens]
MTKDVVVAAAPEAAAVVSRVAACVEYRGTAYRGWQRQQPGVPSVQEAVEKALSRVADHPVNLFCAGRTDAGVHASGQVIHFDSHARREPRNWIHGANANLPPDISLSWVKYVPEDFHARFSASARRYRYVIYNDPIRPAHLAHEVTWNYRPLDLTRMQQAARALLGQHDFSAYRAVACQAKSPIKTIHHLELVRFGQFIVLDIRANAFLHHMVRNIAGVLMQIGCGDKPVAWAEEVLDGQDRRHGGLTAPGYGLYLVDVTYPQHFALPERYLGPHFLSGLNERLPRIC